MLEIELYAHRSSCLSLWFIHSTYFSDYLLSNYHPPGTLLLFSCPVVSDSSRPHGPHHLPEFAQVHVCFVWWCHPAISPSVALFFCFQSFPASGSFPMSQLFASGDQSIGVQLQHQSFQWVFRGDFLLDWLVWSPCSSKDSQESSPTPQFKSINSLVLCFLHSLTLTSIHDHWKNHSPD